jgi:hypothetical protein
MAVPERDRSRSPEDYLGPLGAVERGDGCWTCRSFIARRSGLGLVFEVVLGDQLAPGVYGALQLTGYLLDCGGCAGASYLVRPQLSWGVRLPTHESGMSTLVGIGLLVGGPVIGALSAIALGATATWQIMTGAILGQGLAVVVGRAWSEYAAARTTRRALEATRRPAGDTPLAVGGGAARPTNVVIRATGLTWRDHLGTLAVFSGFAALIGVVVAWLWRIVAAGH